MYVTRINFIFQLLEWIPKCQVCIETEIRIEKKEVKIEGALFKSPYWRAISVWGEGYGNSSSRYMHAVKPRLEAQLGARM